ncbi:MAG: acyl-CoA dehydrogenase family protein [Sphingorhabdus sp.]
MNWSFSAEEEAFRLEVRGFLREWSDLDAYLVSEDKPRLREFYRAVGAKGWFSLSWPEQYGGSALGPVFDFILWEELSYARAARSPLSVGIVARTLLRFGDDAQKRHWLPRIRSYDISFALGYSEPEAGSDLTGLKCRATRDGDHYRIDGEKCWQSGAHEADYLWLLARTGEADSRSAGLSLFIVDLKSAGLSIRPIPLLDGNIVNHLTFDGVMVPTQQRVGPENGAWKMMNESLADERHVQFPAKRVRRDFEELIAFVEQLGIASWPLVQASLAEFAGNVVECEALGLSVLDAVVHGRSAVAEAAANKIAHTDAIQAMARFAMDIGGREALRHDRATLLWRQTMTESIGGGTSEIMRSIIARQALGLAA